MLNDFFCDAKILVIGGAGFLGSKINLRLNEPGTEIHLSVCSSTHLGRIKNLAGCYTMHTSDLTDLDAMKRIVHSVRPCVIFYMAGHGTQAEENNGQKIFKINLLAVNNILLTTNNEPEYRIFLFRFFTGRW